MNDGSIVLDGQTATKKICNVDTQVTCNNGSISHPGKPNKQHEPTGTILIVSLATQLFTITRILIRHTRHEGH